MKARELVFDLYGDYARYLGGEIRLGVITELLEDFGIGAPTTRVTMSRMRKEGWFETERRGRETSYRMTPKLVQYLDAGHERIFRPPIQEWVGRWTLVMLQIPEKERARRDRLKRILSWEGFGQLNSSSWISPRQNTADVEQLLNVEDDDQIDVVTMETGSLEKDRALVARCWDLSSLDSWYADFLERWEGYLQREMAELEPRQALRDRIEVITTYRQVLFLDPFLPRILQPEDWLGRRAFQTFLSVHNALAIPSMSYAADMITPPHTDM
ncbi:hypothetical protein NYP18_13675 [Corynebacterium sp. YIM 101645]|uniref:PaaX family transcriptional regulator n=1 Tax=Corynebacterium lemuris TaxID=1859292 RepID=A0ABT2G3C6_9CORY|nr:PaaX family transcriptional regulator C-terminal domain-containing protein [Corynebacterium lemuris]MCS5480694.1 hypothetical protein [Corynebacterium lemuris]